MAKLFMASKSVSTSNGKAYHLFKAGSKRRRTKIEIEQDKQGEETRKLEVEMKLQKLIEMEEQMTKMKEQVEAQQQVLDQASSLYDQGFLRQKEDGSWVGVNNFEEQQALLAHR